MKLPEKCKSKKEKLKKKPISKEKKGHVLIVAQEIKFARLLSGNEKKTRDRVLKTLKKWLLNCFSKNYEFKESDFIRIWKGLFYAVWMSDKPLVQEELCESIAEILDHFPVEHLKHAMLMTKAGFHILAKEWYGIDQHRMDKFLMLVRRYLRGSLRCLHRASWSIDSCKQFADILTASDGILATQVPQYARNATSMILHFMDCYLEEISKVSQGTIPPASLLELIAPLCSLLVHGTSGALVSAARRCLCSLIKQSEEGLEYTERTKAWESMGCPEGGPEALELEEDDEEEENDDSDNDEDMSGSLDPRAGRVHTWLSPLRAPAAGVADLLTALLQTASPKAQARARITAQRFKQLSEHQYPYKVDVSTADTPPPSSREEAERAANNLRRLEKTLLATSDELALRGLSRKHRKRLLARRRAGFTIIDEPAQAQNQTTAENGEWQIESTEPSTKKPKQTDIEKTNIDKKNTHTDKKKLRHKKLKQIDKQTTKTNEKIIETKQQNGEKQNKNKEIKKQIVNKKNSELKESKKISDVKESKKISDVKESKKISDVKESKKISEVKESKKISDVKKENNKLNGEPKQKPTLNGDSKPVKPKNYVELKKLHQNKSIDKKNIKKTTLLNAKNIHKQVEKISYETPKKVKFVLKNNCMQGTIDYYKSVRQSPSIPFDESKQPNKTNLKVSTPSPINPFFKKKMKTRKMMK